jgi:PEP-CTERM motif-containing protein
MLKKRINLLILSTFLLLLPLGQVKADPLSFSNTAALQGVTRIDLFFNQGVVLTGPQIDFLVDISGIPAAGSDTLRITFSEAGQTIQVISFRIPLFDAFPPPYTQLFSFTLQGTGSQPGNATLLIDILGSAPDFVIPGGPQSGQLVDSYTYNFQVQPVPEPATLGLAGVAVAGIISRARRRNKKLAAGLTPLDGELH